MKNSFVLAVLMFPSFFISSSFAQGIFLEKGEAGFLANGGYSSLKSSHATSIGCGFALGGVMEFDFTSSTSQIKLDMYGLGDEIEVKSQTVSLGVVLIKKTAQLEVNIGYTTSNASTDILLLGFEVGSEIKIHQKLSWYPIFSFAAGIPVREYSGSPVTALGFSSPILIGEHVYLGPTIALSEGDLNWGITGGILISFNTANSDNW
ncbi:MAG: hypothetical protein RBR74_03985 [Ignavibacteriaceae bacterium]|jgi:hypothetical protein|nr:hypothetical protein [Ignavibacteriaceae bacterium]